MVAAVTVVLALSPHGCCCYCNVSVESMGLINGWVHVTWPALGPALAGCRLQHLFINTDLRSESDLNQKTDIITAAECIMYLLCFQTCGLNHT